jgi:hypothetical protein
MTRMVSPTRATTATNLEITARSLRTTRSASPPVLSLYLNLEPDQFDRRFVRSRVNSMLKTIRSQIESGELDHNAAVSLRADIDRCLDLIDSMQEPIRDSIALFLSNGLGLEEMVLLPGRVWDVAVAGPTPYLRPLHAVLDSSRPVATAVLDARRAEVTVFHFGETLFHEVLETEELRKTNLAGWYGLDEYRNRQHGEEARHRLFRNVAGRLEQLRRDSDVEAVMVGGQKEVADALTTFLDPSVRAITTTVVMDLHTLTPPILAATVSDLEAEILGREESGMVADLYTRAGAGDLAVVAPDPVLKAVNRHAVSRLLISGGVMLPGVVCSSCGALASPTDRCPFCGGTPTETSDLIEAMAWAVVETGGTVRHIMSDTRLTDDIVGAVLRFTG